MRSKPEQRGFLTFTISIRHHNKQLIDQWIALENGSTYKNELSYHILDGYMAHRTIYL